MTTPSQPSRGSSGNADATGRSERDDAGTPLRQVANAHEARENAPDDRFVTNPGGYANSLAATKDQVPGVDPHGVARGD